MLMKSQYLCFIGCKSAGHSKVRSELALKAKDLASIHPFVWECLGLQVSENKILKLLPLHAFQHVTTELVHKHVYL